MLSNILLSTILLLFTEIRVSLNVKDHNILYIFLYKELLSKQRSVLETSEQFVWKKRNVFTRRKNYRNYKVKS